MLADAQQIKKAAKLLRRKNAVDKLVGRGLARDRIEQAIKDAEAAAEFITNEARSRIAHRKRAKLKMVKS